MTPIFTGTATDKGTVEFDAPVQFRQHVRKVAGKRVSVTCMLAKSKRSLDQNAWLWGVALPLIADHLGYDHHEHETLHYDLLSVRFGTRSVATKLTDAPPRIVPTRTSSQLNTAEFSSYMEWVVRYAAEHFGVIVPLPDDVALPEAP